MPCCDCSTIEGESELSTTVARYPTSPFAQVPTSKQTSHIFTLIANILYLYTGAVMRDLTVEQHSTWNGLALNHLHREYPVLSPVINQETHRKNAQHALHHLCLVSEPTILYFSANVSSLQP